MEERYNAERFDAIFSDIGVYIRDLEELGIHREEDLFDKKKFMRCR